MISITENMYTLYDQIPHAKNPDKVPDTVFYPKIFGGKIGKKIFSYLRKIYAPTRYYKNIPDNYLKCLLIGINKLTGLNFDSCVINGSAKFYKGLRVTIFFADYTARFRNKKDRKVTVKKCKKGTLLVMREKFDRFWWFMPPRHMVVTFFNSDVATLPDIYLNKYLRESFLVVVRDNLTKIRMQPIGKQCISKYVTFDKMLGKGDYGNVYLSTINDLQFAVKLAKLKPGAVDRPYSRYNTSWYEVLIMRNVLKPLIQKNICPNLPLLIDSFVCNDCSLTIRGKTEDQPCVTTITELADGSFRDFLKKHNPTEEELYSALFQIMAGLHAIQLNGQIMNYDVKADNVLFYTVTPGGYWTYVIHGKEYNVPNFGKLFVLNDFGISRPLSPDFQLYREPTDVTFRLGSRFGIVKKGKFLKLNTFRESDCNGTMKNTTNVKWTDGTTSKGANYRMYRESQEIINSETKLTPIQKRFLRRNNLSDDPLNKNFFLNPEVIPPFEFYNDLQDVVRMFIGGKRTTQRGNHRRYVAVTDRIYKKLKKYNGPGDSLADRIFSTNAAQVLAGYFIERFFTKDRNYTKPLSGKMLGRYQIST